MLPKLSWTLHGRRLDVTHTQLQAAQAQLDAAQMETAQLPPSNPPATIHQTDRSTAASHII
ncbi:hypothetical protein BJ138DRAFT_1120024 [Hygrophoropsis aurantiaca]|uniref:Uncharacterized protein n=1 Tax=Hygrophoropsis aurantiaca TaxID=72124 RepID=A0ACB7ZSZ9_9AGAM|nr:hypothetical protein BJ138DRAFT_1120024 [Hygrophoropsis aurantiaca]